MARSKGSGCRDGAVSPSARTSPARASKGVVRSPGSLGWWRTFGGLLLFGMLRLRHSRGFWGWAVVLLLLASVSLHSEEFGFGSATMAVFVMCIAIPLLCANDLDAGALKNVLVGGHGRSAYVAVLMVLTGGLTLVLLALWWLLAAMAAWIGWRSDGVLLVPHNPVLWVAMTLACALSATAVALFVAVLTRSQPLATIVALLVIGHVPAILVATFLQDAGFADLSMLVWESSLMSAVTTLSSGDLPVGAAPWLIALATTALFCGLSLWAMGRRDVSVYDDG